MEGTVNKKVKQYMIDTVLNLINQNRIFKKVYGIDFIKKRIEENLNEVITDIPPEINGIGGRYINSNKNIMIFLSGKDNCELTINDIKRKHAIPLLVHELIHAIMRKNDEECKELSDEIYKYYKKRTEVELSTGVVIIYDDGAIGIGLNEGLTNWLCGLLGKNDKNSYKNLTNIVYQVENAIGKNKMMKFSKGRNWKCVQAIKFIM